MKKRNRIISILSLVALIGLTSFIYTSNSKKVDCDIQLKDGKWMEASKAPDQTWTEYWQSILLNPYQSEGMKKRATWILNNGLAELDQNEVGYRYYYTVVKPDPSSPYYYDPGALPGNALKTQSTNDKTATSSTSAKEKKGISLTEKELGIYVITSKKVVYDTYLGGRQEIGSLKKGTEILITGETTNGFYRFDYEAQEGYLLFKGKDNIVPIDVYEAAWEETSKIEPTCTEDGKVVYTNSLTSLTKDDEISALGHTLGDEEIKNKPSLFKKGEIVVKCSTCDEVIESREIDSILPIEILYITLGVIIILIITLVFMVCKRKKM